MTAQPSTTVSGKLAHGSADKAETITAAGEFRRAW
jgi:hypothetical protein